MIRPPRTSPLFPYTTLFRSFTSELVRSAPKGWFKYEIIWEKNRAPNFVHAKNRPLRVHENISVFSDGAISPGSRSARRSEEHTSELQSLRHLVCRLLLEKKN